MTAKSICTNRIKPKLLREQKTEALLVFIRTTLEQSYKQIDEHGYLFEIGNEEDNKYVYENLEILMKKLQECVVNSFYLRSLIDNAKKHPSLMIIAKKEEPLMVYYDTLVKAIETKLSDGTSWIPELVVISLLSEWILEEEKSVILYPFLKDFDYIELISKYDNTKLSLNEENKKIVMNMYRISSYLIEKLKNAKYKINTKRNKKRKK
ncbi:hypothetical protein [Arcobacter sp.]|uniref:hypothetical protein n=1 Tax=Arcobacter sp. TaxID=1872629 RepID=UPI003D0F7416